MLLLEKLYSILSVNPRPKKIKEKKSLNYPKRKKEIGRINLENKGIFKSLVQARPSVNLKKINKWSESMEKYKRNISCSNRRTTPYRPILTQGILSAYPDLRAKTSIGPSRLRKLSAEIPNIDYFSNLFNLENDNFEEPKNV